MTVGAVGAASAAGVGKPDAQQLGQDQFLKLMLAQLKNQDPLKPLEPAEFLGQLAQFSTVTGIQEMKGAVSDMAGALRASQALQGATLVGRHIVAVADRANFDGVTSIVGRIDAPTGADSVDIVIKDSSGAVVSRSSRPVVAGSVDFAWDGATDRGQRASRGEYRIEALANSGGRAESVPVQLESRVTSVALDPATGSISLDTDHGPLGFAAVRRVK